MGESHLQYSLLECITNLFLIKEESIERVSKCDDGIVLYLVLLMYAYDMLNTCLLENLSHKFRVTSGYNNQLQTLMIATIVLHYHAL